ncbi:MAG: GPW/gp25 family protein [Methanomicrobiaceae archaeon]|nr:GPW/gp25 family protein [Methanomicrobiaceae archaeon]MDD5418732.1 GPW/gp25 family protein [Methanomicrobiaceae archaeon]
MQVKFPLHFDSRGGTKTAGEDEHIRDLIEQVLFTSPGERVNRPDFGCGLMHLVFAPAGDETSAAMQFMVQGALQKWLSDLIQVEEVSVECREAALVVVVQYVVRRSQERQSARFAREV